jgi:hypothetical protein
MTERWETGNLGVHYLEGEMNEGGEERTFVQGSWID